MDYIYLLLSLTSSLLIAIILKSTSKRKGEGSVVIASNYISAVLISLLLTKLEPIPIEVLLMGAVTGGLFFIGFLVFNHAIRKCGMTSAVTAGRLSLGVPVLISIMFMGESAGFTAISGLLGVVLVVLLWEKSSTVVALPLLILFMIFGFNDTVLKVFKHYYGNLNESLFLGIIFLSALIWSWSYIFFKGIKVKKRDLFNGLIMGAPNFFSSFFVLKALESIPAFVVFPAINVGIIISSALTGYLIFNEKPGKRQILLMIVGSISVILLTG